MGGVPAPQWDRKTDLNSRIVGRPASFQKSRTQRLPGYSGSVLSLLLPNKWNLERRPLEPFTVPATPDATKLEDHPKFKVSSIQLLRFPLR